MHDSYHVWHYRSSPRAPFYALLIANYGGSLDSLLFLDDYIIHGKGKLQQNIVVVRSYGRHLQKRVCTKKQGVKIRVL
jgi:hypothetical protein